LEAVTAKIELKQVVRKQPAIFKNFSYFCREQVRVIANTGRSKDDIHTKYNDYCALKKRIDNPNSRRCDDDIRRMKN
jgi:hypothetical protein